ncbi:hypothetical protein [Endothiovibrio diazotrophicus]
MATDYSTATLARENRQFAGTAGVSAAHRNDPFHPAFLDTDTGVIYPSRFADGRPAPCHLLDGLPAHLIHRRLHGRVLAVKRSIVSGFERAGHFYTREEAARSV